MASPQQRIKMELKQIKQQPETFFEVFSDPGSIFNIHFTILGPIQTAFDKGYYHGVIVLPENYPYSPPDIKFLTESGRFVQYKEICTNFTSFHPETWSSSWGIRVILLGLRSMFDEETPQAVGSIVAPAEQRRYLALKSRYFKCNVCGCDHTILNLYDFKAEAEAEYEQPRENEVEPEDESKDLVCDDPKEYNDHSPVALSVEVSDEPEVYIDDTVRVQAFLQELYNIVYRNEM